MTPQHHLPADIERTSMGIITAELAARGLAVPPENAAVVKRVIHTTADFDYAENLRFTPGAAAAGVAAMRAGAVVVTDTNMALADRHSALWPTLLSLLLRRRQARPGPPPPCTGPRRSTPARCWPSATPPRRC